MDFLSDTARKEKRSLLATGSIGILVAWIGIDQTDIELAGFKFHTPNLPNIIIWSLLAVVTYLLAKFCFSYFYERFNSEMKLYAAQISEGKTAMDINREEKETMEASRLLIEQQKVFQAQQEGENKNLAKFQATIDDNDNAYQAALKILDTKKTELEKALEDLKTPLGSRNNFGRTQIASMGVPLDERQIHKEIEKLEQSRGEFVFNRLNLRQKELQDLQYERNRSENTEKARAAKVGQDEAVINAKRESVSKWRQAHRGATIVTPMHLVLDVGLPILIGLAAIVSLGCLAFHFPTPKPISFPFF